MGEAKNSFICLIKSISGKTTTTTTTTIQ